MTRPSSSELQHAAVITFAHGLVTAALNRLLHAPDSQFVGDSLRALVDALRRAHLLGVEMPLQLQFSDDRMFFDGTPLDGPSLQAGLFLRHCNERHIAMLSFHPDVDVDQLNRCFDLLLLTHNKDALRRDNRDVAMWALGIRHVRVVLRSPGNPGDRRSPVDDSAALHQYQELASLMQQNHVRAHRDLEIAVDEASGIVERTVATFDEPSALLALATQDDVDRFTVGHSVRVALLALQVARELDASREQLVHIGTAALLHDIGKAKVPQEILFKRGRLTAEEWQLMAQHPRLGAQILLEQHDDVDAITIGAAFCHHLGPTGLGYPQPTLPIVPSGASRLIRVCDVFEALTAVRPYKKALTPIEAYAVMFRNEKDFDGTWLRRFVRTLGLFPTGTRVRLDDGSEALVINQGQRASQPVVRLLTGPGGSDLPAGHADRVLVGVAVEGQVRTIAAVSTHDRSIEVPGFEPDAPEVLTACAHDACLSTSMTKDVASHEPAG